MKMDRLLPSLLLSGTSIILLQALTIAPAFAGFYWETGPGGGWGQGNTTNSAPAVATYYRVSATSSDGGPGSVRLYTEPGAAADTGSSGIYQSASSLPADVSIESLSKWSPRKESIDFCNLGDCISLEGFKDQGKLLEWRVHKKDVVSNLLYIKGATIDAPGPTFDPTTVSATPITAVWLFGAGIIGLIGIMRRNQKRITSEG